jgi:flagellar basal-body rod modification protein FlgD
MQRWQAQAMGLGWTSGHKTRSVRKFSSQKEEADEHSRIHPRNIRTGTATFRRARQTSASSTSSSSTSNSSLGTSASSLQDTFLNLLVTELQNQDPTSPVDPTEMVGQMVSLNQLDQLISINQTLSSIAPGSSGSTSSTQPTGTSPLVAADAGSTAAATSTSPRVAAATTPSQQQPIYTPTVDPNALMNLYGSVGATPTN